MKKFEYTLETFEQELMRRFPQNHIKVLEFNGTYKYIKYQCLDCGKIYEKTRANHMYENKTLCQKCYSSRNSKIRDWILDFIKKSQQFDFFKPWNNSVTVPIELYCHNCNRNFKKTASNLYNKKEQTICPFCGDNGAPMPKEDYEKEMKERGYLDYKILDYKGITKSIKLQHSCGYVFSQKGENFLKSKGCPKCFKTISKGEIKIENFLKKNNIEYKYQYVVKEINYCSYDFYLPKYNCLIEYQGEQHYRPVNIFGGEEKFKIQLEHDRIKEKYAKDKNIKLIIIPYTDYNNIDSYLLPLLSSTTSLLDVASSEAKEKTSL